MKPVTLLIIGAGSRGTGYAQFTAELPERAKVVGVAEPRDAYRQAMVEKYDIPPQNVFTDWKQAADQPRLADAVLICTVDAMHADPARAFAEKGYHMMLEKPMAPNEPDCRRIYKAVTDAGILFAVGHVLRYTAFTRKVKRMIADGAVGDIVNIQLLEPVAWWHQAHSFVRGNWGNEAKSSNMLLAKSCHDLDWLRHVMDRPCLRAQSFGSLYHFRPEQRPDGAGDRCLDCAIEPTCPYSAKRIYLDRVAEGRTGWPVDVLTTDVTVEGVTEALRGGPYGCCVYACDNDVVDHQVVNLEFEGGRTASFTMSAFNAGGGRQVHVEGTRGELIGDSRTIEHVDFLTGRREKIDTETGDASILGGHGGGDFGLMDGFVSAVATGDASKILSGPAETLEGHLMVFAAEQSRREGRVVDVPGVDGGP